MKWEHKNGYVYEFYEAIVYLNSSQRLGYMIEDHFPNGYNVAFWDNEVGMWFLIGTSTDIREARKIAKKHCQEMKRSMGLKR